MPHLSMPSAVSDSTSSLGKPSLPATPDQRVLGLDIEAAHGASWGSTFDARIFFGAAMRWEDEDEQHYLKPYASRRAFELWVRPLYTPGVLVVAHNGSYDLGGLNGESIRLGLDSLPTLLLSDTCKHIPQRGNMWSASLQNMCQRYGVEEKGSMSRYGWEEAYRGNREWLARVREYNENDVDCVLALRLAMIEAGDLLAPRSWSPA